QRRAVAPTPPIGETIGRFAIFRRLRPKGSFGAETGSSRPQASTSNERREQSSVHWQHAAHPQGYLLPLSSYFLPVRNFPKSRSHAIAMASLAICTATALQVGGWRCRKHAHRT